MVRRSVHLTVLVLSILLLIIDLAAAATHTVATESEFQTALNTARANDEADTIVVAGNITLTDTLTYYNDPNNPEAAPLVIEGAAGPARPRIIGDTGATFPLLSINTGARWDDHAADITLRNLEFQGGGGNYYGGVYIDVWSADVTVENCHFDANRGRGDGYAGGLYIETSSEDVPGPDGNIYVTNCTFAGNSIDEMDWSGGAGASLSATYGEVRVSGCDFINNRILYVYENDNGAGGLYASAFGPVTLENCTFDQNTVEGEGFYDFVGGGASIESNGHLAVTNCTFLNNSARGAGGLYTNGNTVDVAQCHFTGNAGTENYGGGAFIQGCSIEESTVSVIVRSNTFTGNSTDYRGGGLHIEGTRIECINNVVMENTSTGPSGAGIDAWVSHRAVLINNTIAGNRNMLGADGGGLYLIIADLPGTAQLYNNIVWGNKEPFDVHDVYVINPGPVTVGNNICGSFYFSDFAQVTAPGNLFDDPKLVPDGHLRIGSPAIDAGNDAAPELPATDRDGNPRITGAHVDMGAFEGPYVGMAMPWMMLLLE